MHSIIHNISLILTFRPCSLLQLMTKYSKLLTETAAHLHITTEYQGLKGGSSHIRACGFYVEDYYIGLHVFLCPCYLKPLHFRSSQKNWEICSFAIWWCMTTSHSRKMGSSASMSPPPSQKKPWNSYWLNLFQEVDTKLLWNLIKL